MQKARPLKAPGLFIFAYQANSENFLTRSRPILHERRQP
jgi:hypothetical protein